ncbi:TRAP transporter small permease [Aquabacterium sp.]|uniref:TRAP transporter small permease n=1 Tax=Aquabacterium sp. TaxID=1872578 RepID=UPI002CC7AA94|nr:TRAP transporter small permease [Aquabacterium sp.]HSW05822.1 TRAP transporter small permease [Aquabacterium sp.]
MESIVSALPQDRPAPSLTLRRALDALYLGAGGAGAVFVVLICALMIWQSVAREFGVNTGAVNDIVAWCCAASGFLTMAHAFKHGDFVRVTLLMEKLTPPVKRAFELFSLGVGAVAVGYLTWWACRFTLESWQIHELAQGLLPIPMWIPQLSFALGSILLLIAVVDEFFIVLAGGVPTYERLVAERHAAGDFSSDL